MLNRDQMYQRNDHFDKRESKNEFWSLVSFGRKDRSSNKVLNQEKIRNGGGKKPHAKFYLG